MEIHRGIARLFCVLLVCRAIETLAGSTALRRGRPKLAAEPTHHRALVGSRTVKAERPGLMEHMAAARKRRDIAHQKVTPNLDADVSSEVVNMQEADRVAEDVLKNLDKDTADEDDKDDEKDDATSVGSTSTSSTEASEASKVEAGQTWAKAQQNFAVEASTPMEVKPSGSQAHVEKLTRQLESVKKTWATAQDEVKKLRDKMPQKIGGEVAKLQAKSAESLGSSEDEEESLYRWAKGEADRQWAKSATNKVADTVSKTNSWSAAEHVVGKAATSTDQDSKAQQEQGKVEDATQDRDDDDDGDATQVEGQKDETSAQADAVINRIKGRIAGANAAADAKVAAEKAAAEKAAAEKRAAEEKVAAAKKANAQKAAEKAAAAKKAAAEKAAAEKAAAEKAVAEKAVAKKAAAEKVAAEKAAADKAAADKKAAEEKAAAQKAAVAKKAAAEKAVVEKTDAAAAVAVTDEDVDDDANQVIAPAVQHTPVNAEDTQAAAPTILSPEPVHLAIGGARVVSTAGTDMNSDSHPSVETLDAKGEPSVESDGEATQLAHKKTAEAKSSPDEAWFEEDGGDVQPSSEEVEEATDSSQDSEENVGWTEDELAEQETEEEDLSTSESDSSEEDLETSDDMASEAESLPEDAGNEDHEEQVSEDEVEGENEADIEEDVEDALLQMTSRRNLRRASP